MELPNQPAMIRLAAAIYLPMLAGMFFLVPPGTLAIVDRQRLMIALVVALLGGLATIVASHWVSRRTRWGQHLYHQFRLALGTPNANQVMLLAVLSALGEEVAFRGALQGRIGLEWTALLFALLHYPFRKSLWPWTVFALVMGLALGALTAYAQNLAPAIVLHFMVNYFNLHDIAQAEATPHP